MTLDAKYNNQIIKFDKNKNNLLKLKKKLNKNEERLKYFKNKKKKNMDDNDFKEYFKLVEETNELKSNIKKIENYENESDFFLNTGNILKEYYSQKKHIEKNTYSKDDNININSFFNKTHSINHSKLLDNFLQEIDNNHYCHKKEEKKDICKCKNCNIEMHLFNIEGILECPVCGRVEHTITEYSKPSYKDPPPEISYFAYKRINHFNELFSIFLKYIIDYINILYILIK